MPGRGRRLAALRRTSDQDERVATLEAQLDHERLYPLEWVNRRIRDRFGYEVLHGPFAGLRYPQELALTIEAYAQKLLGTYEQELHPAIERLIARRPLDVINVGSSDGYYTVGLALRLPGARVHAFDTATHHHAVLQAVAAENGVADRIEVGDECTPSTLESLLPSIADGNDSALVVCDCEGCETEVLDPTAAPNLRNAALLIECHDLIHAGITEQLEERFSSTHRLEIVPTRPRWICDHPELDFLPVVTQIMAIHEYREGPMHWMIAEPLG
jgi:hypothetical protein